MTDRGRDGIIFSLLSIISIRIEPEKMGMIPTSFLQIPNLAKLTLLNVIPNKAETKFDQMSNVEG